VILSLLFDIPNTLRGFDGVDPVGSRRCDRAMGKVVEECCVPRGEIVHRGMLSNEGAPSWLDGEGTSSCQSVVGMPDGVEATCRMVGILSPGLTIPAPMALSTWSRICT
jgi:hypothetical protein